MSDIPVFMSPNGACRKEDVALLQLFVNRCRDNPQILHLPYFKFFKEYLESLGANVPPEKISPDDIDSELLDEVPVEEPDFIKDLPKAKRFDDFPKETPKVDPEPESEESEVELDNEGVIEPETVDPPAMGDSEKVVSEEDETAANEKRAEAMSIMAEDKDKAVELLTDAIKLNPCSAALYAKRANILLKQKRVKAALADCEEAIKLNPDSAPAHKFRGRAHRLLGHWAEAAKDLRTACLLDFEEQADEWLKEVLPNATKLEQHERKYKIKRDEKALKEKKARISRAQEEAKWDGRIPPDHLKGFFNPPGVAPDFTVPTHEMPTGPDRPTGGLPSMITDPEIIEALKDPDVMEAIQNMMQNPMNMMKYKDDPKVGPVLAKMMEKMGPAMGGVPNFQ